MLVFLLLALTFESEDATIVIPSPGDPDLCTELATVQSPFRQEVATLRVDCDLSGIYPIASRIRNVDGEFQRQIGVCVPSTLSVPSEAECLVKDSQGVEMFNILLSFVDHF